jgi:hypothetical protein
MARCAGEVHGNLHQQTGLLKATVMHIPSLARLVQCTEDEVRVALQKFGGVEM